MRRVLLVAFATAVPLVRAAPFYSTHFETSEGYTQDATINGVNGWTVTNDTAAAKSVLPALPCGAGQCLSLGPTAAASSARLTINHGEPPAGEMFVDFYIRPVASVVTNPASAEETIDIDGALVAFHRADAAATTGQFYVLDGDGNGGGQWLATGLTATVNATTGLTPSWTRLTLHQNYVTHSWNLWVNNQLAALNCGCHTTSTPGTTTYVAWNGTAQAVHIDDLYLTKTDDSRIGSSTSPGGATITEGTAANGLTAADELRYGTSPYTSDTDSDGVTDLLEIQRGTNPRNAADSAYDAACDCMQDIKLTLGTDPSAKSLFTARLYETNGPGTPEFLRYTLPIRPA